MIKFFRKIRHRLLIENKFGKYLSYAIGEIVLVVIGILIALQINNWNEQRKTNVLEVKALTEIVSDLQYDLASLDNDIRLNHRGLKSVSIIRKALDSKQAYHDSLAIHFGRLDFNTTYTVKTSGFDNLRNLGFQVIAVDSVRKSITDLYATAYSFLKEREELSEQRTYGYFSPRYLAYFKTIKTGEGARATEPDFIPKNFEAMKSDSDFNVLVEYIMLVKADNLYILNTTVKELKVTLSLVEEYLKTISAE